MATIIRVPADYATIQGGVDAASSGDTVLVAAGTYPESIVVDKTLALISESGAGATTIDATGAEVGVEIDGGASNSLLQGFTVRGAATRGGVLSNAAGVIIRSNTIEENYTLHGGGGLLVHSMGTVLIEGNTVRANHGGKGAAAIDLLSSGVATIRGNRFEQNIGGYYLAWLEGLHVVFEGNVVANNSNSTGRFVFFVPNEIRGNTFVGNGNQSGALVVWGPESLRNNIFDHDFGLTLSCGDLDPDSASCNIFWGSADPFDDTCAVLLGENGNEFVDPLFCDAENGDYTLQANSPAANGPCGIIGALPVGCGSTGVGVPSAVGAAPQLVAYPNPARSRVQIQLRSGALDLAAGSAPVDVFGASGRLITTLSLDGGGVEWNVRGVPAGVYWLRVSENPELPPLRLVLTR